MVFKICCKNFLSSKWVTIFWVSWPLFLGLFAKNTLSSRPGCGEPLGMADFRIKNTQLSAESSDSGWGPANGRLNGGDAWCSDNEKPWTSYFQIRLDSIRHVSGIGTQGLRQYRIDYYVKTYALKYSLDGVDWYWYTDIKSQDAKKIFTANKDYNRENRNYLRDTFVTLYLRIFPIEFNRDMCLRVEVYGCPDNKDCTHVEQKSTGDIYSPNYPQPYPQGIDCTWIIVLTKPTKRAAIIFRDFDVKDGQSWSCNGDIVDVFDGALDNSKLIGHFCNGKPISVVKTTGNVLRVHFHSEQDSRPRKGFLAHFISYTPGVDDVRTAVACNGTSTTLNCSSTSNSIRILDVRYGAFPYSVACGSSGANASCHATGTVTQVKSRCQHHRSCNITVGGPSYDVTCPAGVQPRLHVYYQCTGTVFKSTARPTTITTTALPTPPPTNPPSPATETTKGTIPPPTRKTATPPATELVISEIITKMPSPTPTVQGEAGDKQARTDEGEGSGLAIGLAVAVTCVVLLIVAILSIFFWRRKRMLKRSPVPEVTYIAGATAPPRPSQRSGRSTNSSRANEYESVNVLYDTSAAGPKANGNPSTEYAAIYDSPEPVPRLTENPLYQTSVRNDGYESVGPPASPLSNESAAGSPLYDSPLDMKRNPTSITNPNYDKNMIEIPLV